MRQAFRQTVVATAAMVGFAAVAAVAAPTVQGGDPAAAQPAATRVSVTRDKASSVEQRIASLHTKLEITPAQQPQWDQFSQVMRDNAQEMDEIFKTRVKAVSSMTATENMQSYAQLAMNHAQSVQKLVPAFQALYDTMSDSQKQIADKVFRDEAHHPRHG